MSDPLFVIGCGAATALGYCAVHSLTLWWYRRKGRQRFDRMVTRHNERARPWWVEDRD